MVGSVLWVRLLPPPSSAAPPSDKAPLKAERRKGQQGRMGRRGQKGERGWAMGERREKYKERRKEERGDEAIRSSGSNQINPEYRTAGPESNREGPRHGGSAGVVPGVPGQGGPGPLPRPPGLPLQGRDRGGARGRTGARVGGGGPHAAQGRRRFSVCGALPGRGRRGSRRTAPEAAGAHTGTDGTSLPADPPGRRRRLRSFPALSAPAAASRRGAPALHAADDGDDAGHVLPVPHPAAQRPSPPGQHAQLRVPQHGRGESPQPGNGQPAGGCGGVLFKQRAGIRNCLPRGCHIVRFPSSGPSFSARNISSFKYASCPDAGPSHGNPEGSPFLVLA